MFVQRFRIALHEIPQHFAFVEDYDHQHLPLGFIHAYEGQPVCVIGICHLPHFKWSDQGIEGDFDIALPGILSLLDDVMDAATLNQDVTHRAPDDYPAGIFCP